MTNPTDNTKSLHELIAKAEKYAQDCYDNNTELRSVEYVAPYQIRYTASSELDGLFGLTGGQIARGDLTRHAFGQLVERINAPSTGWLTDEKRCSPALREKVMNDVLDARGNKHWLVRHKGDDIRALLSDKYTRFDNVEFLELVADAVQTMGTEVRVHRPEVGDELRAYILIPAITFDSYNGDQRYGGLHPATYIANSEIGNGFARAMGGLYRNICSNGVIYGWKTESLFKVRHSNKKSELMRALVADAIATSLHMSEKAANAFVQAYNVHVRPASLAPIIEGWAAKYGITVEARESWSKSVWSESVSLGHAGDPRKADIVNALTYVAQARGAEERETMERMAGDMLAYAIPAQYLTQVEG